MDRTNITGASPYEGPIGFSRAVRIGQLVEVSGTGPVWPDGSVDPEPQVQAARCFTIALEALTAAGGRPEDVVRTRMYLTDAADWEAVGRAHAEAFSHVGPAATMVVVAGLLDPRWKVEIEISAVLGHSGGE
jgi:enamine deaminase RidA (YjgF/YER057c/UK114 family)